MRPRTHRSPIAHPRELLVTLSLLAFSLNGAALAATQQPTAPSATDGTTMPEPPPFIETTGHGLAPYTQPTSPATGTSTSTSTSTSATSGEPTTKDTLSTRSTKTSSASAMEQLSPVERYLAWLYGLLGMQ